MGDRVARGPRRVIAGSIAVLLFMCAGLAFFSTDLTTNDSYRTEVESVEGQEILSQHFPAGASAPVDIVVPREQDVPAVQRAVEGVAGVEAVSGPVASGDAGVLIQATLEPQPYSTEAFDLVDPIREAAHRAAPGTLVGGASAVEFDVREAAAWDSKVIPPIVLVVVFLILALLLRAVVVATRADRDGDPQLPGRARGGLLRVRRHLRLPGSDPSLPLFAFVFLVALGVDYNIFLVARAREETLEHGTREGMLRALAVTGGVITSAGIVLAGTFSVLAVLPLVFLTEIGFVVAFGVLLDTFLVRSVLVPALVLQIGPKVWWPSSLARAESGGGRHVAAGLAARAHAQLGGGQAEQLNSRWSELPVLSSRTQLTGTHTLAAAPSRAPSTPGRAALTGERSQKGRSRPTSSSDSAHCSRSRAPCERARRASASAPRWSGEPV